MQELAQQWCRRKSAESVARYASTRLGNLRNVKSGKLCELVGSFDATWEARLREKFADELDALDGLMNLRNQIAHGVSVGTSLADAQRYFQNITAVLDHLNDVFDPV